MGCDSLEDKKGRFLLKGNKKMEEKDPKTALGFYEEAIALDSNFSDAYYNKGMAHLQLNQLEPAIQDFSKAIQKNPKAVDAVFQRGLAYLDLGANYNAKEDASRMVSESPSDWRSYFLARLMIREKPGIIHFHEMQHAAYIFNYLVNDKVFRIKSKKIISTWGSDLTLYSWENMLE